MALSDDIVNNSIQGIQQGGPSKTVGDAMQAYQMSTQTQAMQQKLQQDRDKNEMDKSNFFVSSINNIAKIGGNAQKLALDSFSKHVQQMYPGYNQDITKMIKDDDTMRQNLFSVIAPIASKGGIKDPDSAAKIGQFLTMNSADAPMYLEKLAQQQTELQKASIMAEAAKSKQGAQLNSREAQAAERQWNAEFSTTKPIVQRLEGANRILDLIDAGERGEFKTNKAFLSQVNKEIYRLEIGSQQGNLTDSEKAEMQSSIADFKAVADKFTNKVSSVDLHNQFKQARGQIGEMQKSYLDMGNRKAEDLKAGALDNQMPVFQAKHDMFMSHYANRGKGSPAPVGAAGAVGGSSDIAGPHGPTVVQNGHQYKWNGKAYVP